MESKQLFDCTTTQQHRPNAIEYLMNFRRKLERDDSQFKIEQRKGEDGSVELKIVVSPLRTGEKPNSPKIGQKAESPGGNKEEAKKAPQEAAGQAETPSDTTSDESPKEGPDADSKPPARRKASRSGGK